MGSDPLSDPSFEPVNVALRDGRSVMIRAVRADDAEGMQAAMVRLSEEARYTRFMAPLKELSPAMLERAVRPVPDRDLALVAVAGEADGRTHRRRRAHDRRGGRVAASSR